MSRQLGVMGAHVTCKISERSHVVEQVREAKWPTRSQPSKSARRSGRPGPTKQVRETGRPYRPYQESQQSRNSSKASRSPRQLGQYMTTPEAEASHANDRPRARRVTAIDMTVPPQVRPPHTLPLPRGVGRPCSQRTSTLELLQ